MSLIRILTLGGFVFLASCASSVVETEKAGVDAAESSARQVPELTFKPTELEIAMSTVEKLKNAQNPQAAIDRLTQILEQQNIKPATRSKLLEERGMLRFNNYDVFGSIADFETILDEANPTADLMAISEQLDTARAKATSLNFKAESPSTSRTERAELLFELGEHGDALDQIRSYALTPNPDILLAMLHIGYLCEGPNFTGRGFNIRHSSGASTVARFCDSGK